MQRLLVMSSGSSEDNAASAEEDSALSRVKERLSGEDGTKEQTVHKREI